jgi:Undecaprenyl-phosphate galactose phosphotransferase WbaP
MELSTRTKNPDTRKAPPDASPRRGEAFRRTAQLRAAQEKLRDPAPGRWGMVTALVAGDLVGGLLLVGIVQVGAAWVEPASGGWPLFAVAALIFGLVGILSLAGFHRARFVHPALEMKEMALMVGVMAAAAGGGSGVFAADWESVLLVCVAGGVGTVLIPLTRGMTRVLGGQFSWWGVPTVVVSFEQSGEEILDTLHRWPEMGLRPVGWLTDAGEGPATDRVHSDPERAPTLAQSLDIPYAVVSLPERAHPDRAKLLAHYSKFFDRVFSVSRFDAPVFWSTGQWGDGLRGYRVRNAASDALSQGVKRAVDLLGAAIILLLLAPLFATLAVLIRLDSKGPVFYRQERMGKGGEVFTLLKFRSMYQDADERLHEVLAADPQRRREYEKYHKLSDDPRVTPIGDLLRRYSLDELPQLLNVIRGEMSLVGPRAYIPAELPDMKGLENVILQTPPGVTGLWQVSGRNQLGFERRIDLDVHYVQNWSLWLDLYLLLRTIPTVLTGEGAA